MDWVHCVHFVYENKHISSILSIVSIPYHRRCTRVAPKTREGDLNFKNDPIQFKFKYFFYLKPFYQVIIVRIALNFQLKTRK